MFKDVESRTNFPEMEKGWLKKWYKDGTVKKYLQKNDKSEKRFSFMDGPITANNPMGIHHAWGRTYKDLWQRYKNMKGYKQRFQNGFDNQGLWVEVEVEKDKGFKSKKDIEKYGIAKFVQDCKDWTKKWANVQTEQSKRLGYFMDWENSYYTMSEENNYMIWTFLNKCHENGWIYKGKDALPWCPRCGTAISQHEILTGDYIDLEDETIYFYVPIKGRKNEYLMGWTTAPWTLPANVAVAVDPKLNYVKVQNKDKIFYLSESTLNFLDGEYEVLDTLQGKDLVGLEYDYPFKNWPAVKAAKPQYKVVPWEGMIGEEEGSGMVHIAPGCGPEDHQLGKEENLSVIIPIDDAGNFVDGFEFLTGKFAHDVSQELFDFMKQNDALYKIAKYTHRYPMCWRCKSKLVFRCVDEWYISMDELRYKMMEVAKKIRWIPEFGLDRELDWLTNMHDWCISKKRYWGLALPIWECECGHFEVIKDEVELKKRAVEGWDKFEGHTPHRPYIDEIKIKCPKCGKLASRIRDVGNPWLDAGIVPYSTIGYRTNKEYWKKWFPTDFVTECFPGQFKNWFYALIAMSTVLENKEPYKTLLGHGLVKDEKGDEMHKSAGNAIWFDDGVEKIGADVMRWTFCRHNPENDLWFGYNMTDDVRKNFILMLWNVYKYLISYANRHNWKPSGKNVYKLKLETLDRWVLSKFNTLLRTVDKKLEDYDAMSSALSVESFVNDLSTWYIRRSRQRFADGDKVVLEVLYYIMHDLTRLMMPFTPFLAEEMYQNLKSEKEAESVHLTDFPEYSKTYEDRTLEDNMAKVQNIASLGLAARFSAGVKLRQPLLEIQVKGIKDLPEEFAKILVDEVNVQKAVFVKELPKGDNYTGAEDQDISVVINTKLTDELQQEGLYREVVRQIQQARKEAGLKMGELVDIVVCTDSDKVKKLIQKRNKDFLNQLFAKGLSVASSENKQKSTKSKIFATIKE
ncbi:isoleucine--tRNA ligase [Candidatus Dojkabacteria bacterium]|nr:isoleucine--tRNA ligase [Candidatus Dojkabacteria bacterium]